MDRKSVLSLHAKTLKSRLDSSSKDFWENMKVHKSIVKQFIKYTLLQSFPEGVVVRKVFFLKKFLRWFKNVIVF